MTARRVSRRILYSSPIEEPGNSNGHEANEPSLFCTNRHFWKETCHTDRATKSNPSPTTTRTTKTNTMETSDDMMNVTVATDMCGGEGLETPSHVSNAIGHERFIIPRTRKKLTHTVIDTMLHETESAGTQSLLGTQCEPRLTPNLHEHIGEGTTGHVYSEVTREGQVAVKFQRHSSGSEKDIFAPGPGSMNVPMNAFSLEVNFQLRISSIGISPSVCNAWTSPYSTIWGDGKQDVLVTDRLDEIIVEKTRRGNGYTDGVMELVSKDARQRSFFGRRHALREHHDRQHD